MEGALSRLRSKSLLALGGWPRPANALAIVLATVNWAVVTTLAILVIGTALAMAAGGAMAAQATDARVSGNDKKTTFELDLTDGVTAEVFTLANPYRVIVDLPDVTFQLKTGAGEQGQGLVQAFRYGLFAERKGRVVIDTTGPVKIAGAAMTRLTTGGGIVLKVSLEQMDADSFGAGTGAGAKTADAKPPAPEEATVKPKNRTRPVIVIDAGHGGIDPGAVGVGSVAEKTIVLAVAQQVKAALAQTGRYDAKMTRSTDVFVSLDRRLKLSSDYAADLFISLHADSIQEKNVAENIRGATVYTLSEKASDEQARIMAEKENASDLIAGLETADAGGKDQVKNILIDLLKRETSNFSTDFSNVVAAKLGKAITMSRDPKRSAAFKVLKQSHAPSVLIELGYMSDTLDQQQMTTLAWQKQVGGSIAAAVQAYFTKRTAEHP